MASAAGQYANVTHGEDEGGRRACDTASGTLPSKSGISGDTRPLSEFQFPSDLPLFRIPKLSLHFPICSDLCFCIKKGLDIGHEGYHLNPCIVFYAIPSLVFHHFLNIKAAYVHPSLERLVSCLDVEIDVRGKSVRQLFPVIARIAFTNSQPGPQQFIFPID